MAVQLYQASGFYKKAQQGENYFRGENEEVLSRKDNVLIVKNKELRVTTPITSNLFRRLIIQQNATLLSNGVQIGDEGENLKDKLGIGFDRVLAQLGENATKHGVAYGYWDYDHVTMFTALEFFTLNDERSDIPMAGIRFWSRNRANDKTVTFIEFYETDGVTEFAIKDSKIEQTSEKTFYGAKIRPLTNDIESIIDYPRLPIVPFWGNFEHIGELTTPIKSKIDLIDKIYTNFGDATGRINLVYWILHNYSVEKDEALNIIREIEELGIVAAQDDKFTAEAKTFDIPVVSVEQAVKMVELAIYNDFMGVSIDEITGGSLTNVAINTTFDNLMKKVARYSWQPFFFVQGVMEILGLPPTENIRFKYEMPRDQKEYSDMLINASDYLDEQTILEHLPFIEIDEVEGILKRLDTKRQEEIDDRFPIEDEVTGNGESGTQANK